MDFNEYQFAARETAIYPNMGNCLYYPVLGLCGESGEVAEQVKKAYRDDGGEVTPERMEKIKKELGDVLWYVANTCYELNLSMEAVAVLNIEKLKDRKNRDKLHGSGDDR